MDQDFRLSVSSSPSGGLSFDEELRLVKVGLLYADHTVLCSPKAVLFSVFAGLGALDENQQLDLMLQLAPTMQRQGVDPNMIQEVVRRYKQLRTRAILTHREKEMVKRIRKTLADTMAQMSSTIDNLLAGANAEPLARAINSGLVSIHPLGSGGDVDSIVAQYVEFVLESAKASSSFPLFDKNSGDLLEAHIREGKIVLPPYSEQRARNAPLVASLLERLPQFENASIEELLAIRSELAPHLVRFRAAILRLSATLRSMPWDDGFAPETDTLVRAEVLPAIQDITDAIKSNEYLSSVLLRVMDKPVAAAAGSVLGLAISKLADIPGLAVGAVAGGAGLAAAWLIAHKEWLDRRREIKGNQLFFYYRAAERMG